MSEYHEGVGDGGPAYPHSVQNGGNRNVELPNGTVLPPGSTATMHGMSLRDHFAGLAMQACVQGHLSHYGHESNHWATKDIASHAYELADAMLAERARSRT